MKVYDICKLMYSTLDMDCINEILKWVEMYHVQKGFLIWKIKMRNNNLKFLDQETIDHWFVNVTFFYNANYIKFIDSYHLENIYNRDCVNVPEVTKDYYGITRFPKYCPDFIIGNEFDMIGFYFDSEYSHYSN